MAMSHSVVEFGERIEIHELLEVMYKMAKSKDR
jgi:hypothetical protein